MIRLKYLCAALLLAAPLAVSGASAGAAAVPVRAVAQAAAQSTDVLPVQWRRGGWGRGGYWGGPRIWGGGAAIVGGVIVGSAVVAAAIAENRAAGSAVRACARDYRSFDRASGTFVDREGRVRVCPYLY